ncbi:MAG: phytoene/squalene synthase family protein [Hyphomonadaceae bacterium]
MENLDQLVRRVDEDRWLASRFAPAFVRERLTAIYAVNYEIARTAETVHEAALGDIRLEWWRSALEEIAQGEKPRAHPALEELARTMKDPLHATLLQEIVTARRADLDPRPFANWVAVEAYVDATAGVLMHVSAEQCAAPRAPSEAFIEAAGRAWGLTGLLRALEFWRAKGRSPLPREGGDATELAARARAAYEAAQALAISIAQEAFPAIGYVALVPGYLRTGGRQRSLFGRHARLIAASATGRI